MQITANHFRRPLFLFSMAMGLIWLGSCALAPVESDSQKAAERHAAMARDCYKRGGTWNDSVKTCVGADAPR